MQKFWTLLLTVYKFWTIIIISDGDLNFAGREVINMTDMRRVTIPLPDEIDRRILELKKDDKYIRLSYAEVVRQLLVRGLEACGNGE